MLLVLPEKPSVEQLGNTYEKISQFRFLLKKKNFIVCCVVKVGGKVVKNPAFFKLVTGQVEGVGGPGFVLHFITVIALWVHKWQPTPYMTWE